MNENSVFDDVLNECLDRLLKGETVEQCLRDYPEQASELEPLLRTAWDARIASSIQPRSEFKARARYEFQSVLREMEMKKRERRPFFSWHWPRQPGLAIALVAVVVMVVGGGSVVVASSFSMPDSPLYSVKLATENAALAMTPSELGKAELNNKFADRRTDEIIYMASRDNPQEVQVVAQLLNTNLENVSSNLARPVVSPAGNSAAPIVPQDTGFGGPPDSTAGSEPMMGIASAPGVAGGASPEALQTAPFSAPQPASEPPVVRSAPEPGPAPDMSVEKGLAVSRFRDGASEGSFKNSSVPDIDYSSFPASVTQSKDWDKLKNIIESYRTRLSRMEEALNTASPEVRPAIRDAIAKSLIEYERVVANLYQQ